MKGWVIAPLLVPVIAALLIPVIAFKQHSTTKDTTAFASSVASSTIATAEQIDPEKDAPRVNPVETINFGLLPRMASSMTILKTRLKDGSDTVEALWDLWLLTLIADMETGRSSPTVRFKPEELAVLRELMRIQANPREQAITLTLMGRYDEAKLKAEAINTSSWCGNCAFSFTLGKMQTLCRIEFLSGKCKSFVSSARELRQYQQSPLGGLAPLSLSLLSAQEAVCHERNGDIDNARKAAALANESLHSARQEKRDFHDWREYDINRIIALSVANQVARLLGKPVPDDLPLPRDLP